MATRSCHKTEELASSLRTEAPRVLVDWLVGSKVVAATLALSVFLCFLLEGSGRPQR